MTTQPGNPLSNGYPIKAKKGDSIHIPLLPRSEAVPADAPEAPLMMWNGYEYVTPIWRGGLWRAWAFESVTLEYPQTTIPGVDEILVEWIE